jgi:hypothetical protein
MSVTTAAPPHFIAASRPMDICGGSEGNKSSGNKAFTHANAGDTAFPLTASQDVLLRSIMRTLPLNPSVAHALVRFSAHEEASMDVSQRLSEALDLLTTVKVLSFAAERDGSGDAIAKLACQLPGLNALGRELGSAVMELQLNSRALAAALGLK